VAAAAAAIASIAAVAGNTQRSLVQLDLIKLVEQIERRERWNMTQISLLNSSLASFSVSRESLIGVDTYMDTLLTNKLRKTLLAV
jgi:hypothetical protein